DLREYVDVLKARGKLFHIKREINKDTELMPLVRWQFRGLQEKDRGAFLFDNIVDAKGNKFNVPLLVCCYAPSTEVYAIGMMCEPKDILDKWTQAQLHPIAPVMVNQAPVQEIVHQGDSLLEHGGLMEFPIPLSTPGFDNAPYITAGSWVTKDPETGERNVGVYRGMLRSSTRTGINCYAPQHLRIHWEKCKSKGIPLQAAIILGSPPNIGYVGCTKIPFGTDEYSIAGGISGEPVELVKCKTVDLEVPANAEVIIEGTLPTDLMEFEGPFGEHPGYLGSRNVDPYFNITCITHRKNPIDTAWMDQFPPSEDTKIRNIAYCAVFYKFLKYDCNIPGVLDVALHEESGSNQFCVIKMKKSYPAESWQALFGISALNPNWGKIVVVVDEDIDPRDMDSVTWARCYRMQPHRDIRIVPGKSAPLDPSAASPEVLHGNRETVPTSALLIDATMKWPYPPVSLPRKEYMDKARQIWEAEGLPALSPKVPWHGYTLGHWTEENIEEANLAVKGEWEKTGEKFIQQRQKA
ncbi:MAG: UbiD family decarboxylase, partial [Dehalococcoidia bacterium]|nr:UbiD family decarboxylase [Dehalococcoidia bacterium]